MSSSSSSSASSSTSSSGSSSSFIGYLLSVAPALSSFRGSVDLLAFAIHAAFLQRGFKCVALSDGDPDVLEHLPAPKGWNRSADEYCFQYSVPATQAKTHTSASASAASSSSATAAGSSSTSSSMLRYVVVRSVRMDGVLAVSAVEKGKSVSASFDATVAQFVDETKLSDLSQAYKDVDALHRLIYTQIIQRFIPSDSLTSSSVSATNTRGRVEDDSADDPLRVRGPSSLLDERFRPGPSYPGARRGDFEGDLMPGGFGESSGMLLGPRNFPGVRPNAPFGMPRGPGGLGPRFDPPGPFGGVGGDPDNDIFRPPGGPGAPRRGGPPII